MARKHLIEDEKGRASAKKKFTYLICSWSIPNYCLSVSRDKKSIFKVRTASIDNMLSGDESPWEVITFEEKILGYNIVDGRDLSTFLSHAKDSLLAIILDDLKFEILSMRHFEILPTGKNGKWATDKNGIWRLKVKKEKIDIKDIYRRRFQ